MVTSMKKTSPAAIVDARARARDALGPLLDDLAKMRPRETRRPGSTYYPALLAALVDNGWPIPAIERATGVSYADIQRHLAKPTADPATLPEDIDIPDYPDEVTAQMRSMRRGPAMDPAVADFIRRLDAVGNADLTRFESCGGSREEYDLLAATYTRDGLLGIGSAAIQREQKRGVSNGALARGLSRTYTSLAKRSRLTLDCQHGWVIIPSQDTGKNAPARYRYVFRADADANRDTTARGRNMPAGHQVDLATVPTSPYAPTPDGTEDSTAVGDTMPLFHN